MLLPLPDECLWRITASIPELPAAVRCLLAEETKSLKALLPSGSATVPCLLPWRIGEFASTLAGLGVPLRHTRRPVLRESVRGFGLEAGLSVRDPLAERLSVGLSLVVAGCLPLLTSGAIGLAVLDWGAGVFQQWGLGSPPRPAGKMSKLCC